MRAASTSFYARRTVGYEPGVSFTKAQWIQEDPPPALNTPYDSPYPRMSQVSFDRLRVNRRPHLTLADGQVLIPQTGQIQVPTPVRRDSFAFVAPTGYARQYLDDARAFDFEATSYDQALVRWSETSILERRMDVGVSTAAQRAFVARTDSQKWSPSTRRALDKVAAAIRQVGRDVPAWSAAGFDFATPAGRKYSADDREVSVCSDEVRATLRLPPID